MKRKVLEVAAVIFYFVSFTSYACAQKENHLFLFNKQISSGLQRKPEFAKWISAESSELNSSDVQIRAMKDFKTRFANTIVVKWCTFENGMVAYFKKDGYLNRVYYNKAGNWQYSLITYGEKDLPGDIRASVKSVYYDWSISHVEEIQTSEKTVYMVTVESGSQIRRLRLDDLGNMDIYLELNKS